MNLSEWARGRSQGLVQPLGQGLHRLGVSPNALTVTGLVGMALAGVLVAVGALLWGGLVVALASSLDALDGAVARAAGRVSRWGAFLDSTLDRLAEVAVHLGLLVYVLSFESGAWPAVLVLLALSGSLLVSYARARAEGLGLECKVGLFTRLERVVVLILGLVLGQVVGMLLLLALMTHVTALQRFAHVWRRAA